MSNYEEVVTRVVADLAREGEPDITAAAGRAVDMAIKHYENQQWYFLETRSTITASSSQEYYTLPADFKDMESITIEINNNTYPLIERSYSTIEDWNIDAATYIGYPTDYALFGNEIRVYPVSNGEYPMVLSYHQSIGPPTASGSNAWTSTAELMIHSRAMGQLQALRFQNPEGALLAKQVEQDEYNYHQRLNIQRMTTGKPRKRRI